MFTNKRLWQLMLLLFACCAYIGSAKATEPSYGTTSDDLDPISIFVECVRPNTDGTYTAIFGYLNNNDEVVEIPVGPNNKFTPSPQDRGQTTVFQPGRVGEAFEVIFDGNNLVWTLAVPGLNARTATASQGQNACKLPISVFVECVKANNDGSFTALFGYNNPNNEVINIPVGDDNFFNRGGQDQGQTTAFQPGRVGEAFEVNFDGNNLVWTVRTPTNGRRTTTANKDFKACPQSISIFVECVRPNDNGGYTAIFGYLNRNASPVEIPVGDDNTFNRGGQDQGQTTVFQPGRVGEAFEVDFDGENLVWTLRGPDGSRRTTTANKDANACKLPISVFVECVKANNDGSFTALFGYNNPNDFDVNIPVGDDNFFNRGGQDQGQTTAFQPGRVGEAFEVNFDGNNLVWTVRTPTNGRRTTTANKDFKACPQSISIFVECVRPNDNGGYTAIFGYLNRNASPVEIPVGDDNTFNRGGQDQGQTTVFQPGRVGEAFEVDFDGNNLVWTLRGPDGSRRTTTANKDANACKLPISVFVECVKANNDGSFTALFGYNNPNDFEVNIPVGDDNFFNRGGQDQGQTTAFQPGRVGEAFEVNFDGNNLVWTVRTPTNGRRTTTANKDFKACPQSISIFVECVRPNDNGGYTAIFGYLNRNASPVEIPVGDDNTFNRGGQDQGQTTVFQPGRVGEAFEVDFDGENLVWTLRGPDGSRRTTTANKDFKRCTIEPICDDNTVSFKATNAVSDEFGPDQSDHSVALLDFYGQDQDGFMTFEDGAFLQYEEDCSSAILYGFATFDGGAFAGTRWEISVPFEQKNNLTRPKKELKPNAYIENGGPVDIDSWKLMLLDSDRAELREVDQNGEYTGRIITLDRMPESGEFGLQIGQGANGKNIQLGASSWFFWEFEGRRSSGDFNLNLEALCVEASDELEFFLVDAYKDEVLFKITDGMKINVDDLSLRQYSVIVSYPSGTESVKLVQNAPFNFTKKENVAPYALFGDNKSDYDGRDANLGSYEVSAMAFSADNMGGTMLTQGSVNFAFVKTSTTPAASIKFHLVNADTDQVMMEITPGMQIDLDALNLDNFNIIASTYPSGTESMRFTLNGPVTHNSTENMMPYAVFGDNMGTDFYAKKALVGEYNLNAKAYSLDKLAGSLLGQMDLNFSFIKGQSANTIQYFLVDAVSDQMLFEIENGMEIDLGEVSLSQFNIVASNTPALTQSVGFVLNGPGNSHNQTENIKPFALFGDDTKGNFFGETPVLGSYALTGKAFSNKFLGGNLLEERAIQFSFVNSKAASKVVNTVNGTGNTVSVIVAKSTEEVSVTYSLYYESQTQSGMVTVPAGATQADIEIIALNIPDGATFYLTYQYPGEAKKTIRLVK